MFSVYQSIKDYLDASLTLYTGISLNGLVPETESITIKGMPSASNQMAFDTQRIVNMQFQVMTKSLDQKKAMETMEQIAEALQNAEFDVVGYNSVYCLINSEPQFLERTNSKEYIFTASFKAELEKER